MDYDIIDGSYVEEPEELDAPDILDKLKQVGTGLKEQALAEVEARANRGAKEAIKMPLMIVGGVSAVALIFSVAALLKR